MTELNSRKLFSAERRADATAPTAPTAGDAVPVHVPDDSSTLALEVAAMRMEIAELKGQIAEAVVAMTQAAQQQPAPPPEVSQPIAADVPASPAAETDASVLAVQLEIAQLVKSMARAKSEIAAIKHPMADDDRLLAASNELDAIVRATEVATQDILSAAEEIDRITAMIAGTYPDDEELQDRSHKIIDHVVHIMEASNFQDITGQRISKVVETVRFIEQRVLSMIAIWGVEAFEDLPMQTQQTGTDDSLLNGPQMENQGISQADIDALFE